MTCLGASANANLKLWPRAALVLLIGAVNSAPVRAGRGSRGWPCSASVPPRRLVDANALIGMAESTARVTGPALAGILIGLTQPATVIAVDAATFGVSLVSLGLLTIPAAQPTGRSPWRDLADGWNQFRSQAWLCVI